MLRSRSLLSYLLAAVLALGLAVVLPGAPSAGFKPYTHAAVGDSALADVVDDGRVTVNGRSYAVRPRVVDALRAWPTYYRAGTIGPDGFPDLTFGQSVIHPQRTGTWLRFVLRHAWAAQHDSTWSKAEKGQILAFAYGFLTHAAGDLWAHTLVNDFAGGVFPDAAEIVSSPAKASIALRHIIVEGYVGDATPGFDGNPERTVLPGGDVSDDSTPAVTMEAPVRWLHRTLVDPRQALPTGGCGNGNDDDRDGLADDGCFGNKPYTRGKPEQRRGPLIDFFLDLHSDLQLRMELVHADKKHRNCWIKDPDCYKRTRTITVDTVRGRRQGTITVQACIGARFGCLASPSDLAADNLTNPLVEKYLKHWIEDIDAGLRAWGQLGLATTRGLFDPQARRDLQNAECSEYAESDAARESCEAKIGVTDVVMDKARPFINNHLLSMLGAPDVTGKALEVLQAISKFLDSILGKALNPLRVPLEELRKKARKLVLDQLRKVVGIDLATLEHMLKNPSVWMEVEQIQLDLGGSGLQTVKLFPPGTRDRLDAILGLTPNDRRTTTVPMPDGSQRTVGVLNDQAVARNAAPIDNAVTLSKLLLLDGDGLNRVVSDNLAALGVIQPGTVARVYGDGSVPANVMVDQLRGDEAWLAMIDGDHQWRHDGRPRFGGGTGHGGNGTFPLWESCVARPSFGALFRDWENGTAQFPALGDPTGADGADAAPPKGKITKVAPSYLRGGIKVSDLRLFLGVGHLEFRATDELFAGAHVRQRVRVQRPEGFVTRDFGEHGEYLLPDTDGASDGDWRVTLQTADPCHDLVKQKTLLFTHDTRDPVVTLSEPADGQVVDSAARVAIDWEARDPGGHDRASGVDHDRTLVTLGGNAVAPGTKGSVYGLPPGEHFVEVLVVDHVENRGATYRPIEVRATSASLLENVAQGVANQAFSSEAVRVALEESLGRAAARHDAGDHAAERDALLEARSTLVDERGTGVSAFFADWMVAHVDDLLSRHGS